MNTQFFDDIANKITKTLPPVPSGVKAELEQSVQTILHNAFDKLELVTREEASHQRRF